MAPHFFFRQASEQYLTSSQTFSHALRQTIGRPQAAQILTGRSDFLRIFTGPNLNAVMQAQTVLPLRWDSH